MALMASTGIKGTQNKNYTVLKQIGNQSLSHLDLSKALFQFSHFTFYCCCCCCSNFDLSLALKLAPVCQEGQEAEHARLLLLGQPQHRGSSKIYLVAILVTPFVW